MLTKDLRHNLMNIPGWRTNRKLVVIESDDWGSIRMPSKSAYQQFLKSGIRVDKDPYCKYDNLATREDLTQLFEVLHSVKDIHSNPAILTANTIVANPDFDKIRASEFKQYFYEPFTTTLQKYPEHEKVVDLWKEGISQHVFRPQFHGREHLNVKKWLHALQANDFATRMAFDLGTFGLTSHTNPNIIGTYMGAFDSDFDEDINWYQVAINSGLKLFTEMFEYNSKSFIPTTYTWSPKIEPILKQNGVNYLQGMVSQRIPLDNGKNFKYKNTNFQGRKNNFGLIYLTRNCYFEPAMDKNFDWIDDCLSRIQIAFRWKKAAVICSHRLNFIGNINAENRTVNLKIFKKLLQRINNNWPDVEFISSDALGDIIRMNKV